MKSMIESLEGRTLFAAGGVAGGLGGAALLARAAASTDPAVQTTFAQVQADGAAIEAARQQLKTDSSDTRPALRDTIRAGAELLAADKRAVLESRDDPAALEAAKAKLKADRAQVRGDIAAAREALRDDTVEARNALRDAVASLRAHLRQLRIDLRNAGSAPTQASQAGESRGVADAIADATGVSSDRVQGVIDKVQAVAEDAAPVDRDLVRTLVDNFVAAVGDRDITASERDQLRADARAVLDSANISRDDLRAIADDVEEIVRTSNLAWDDVVAVGSALVDVYAGLLDG